MTQTPLGKTGISVSRLCFGTLTLSPIQMNTTNEVAASLLTYACRAGINIMDTAEFYNNYSHIRQAGQAIDDMMLITKCHAYDEQGAARSLQTALAETGRSSIDLMMLHEQESEWTLRGHAQALAYFYRQKQKGVIRAVGISTHFVHCARAAASMQDIDVIEAICNPAGLGIPDGSQMEMNDALMLAHDNGKGIVAMKALGGGHFSCDAKHAIESVLGWSFVDTLAVGMQSEAEIDYNISLAEGRERSDLTSRIMRQERCLHIAEWCIGCGECAKRCQAGALTLWEGKMHVDKERCVMCGYCAPACREFCIKVY